MLATALGIHPQNITIACTHTHSGPATMALRNCGTVDPTWMIGLPAKLAEAGNAARANRQNAQLAAGGVEVPGISGNRRRPDGPIDRQLQMLRLESEAGQHLASILSFACHPVAAGSGNRLFSSDVPGGLVSNIEAEKGGIALFVNGACGDINPNVDGTLQCSRGNADIAHAIGCNIGLAGLALWDKLEALAPASIAMKRRALKLPLLPCPAESALLTEARHECDRLGHQLASEGEAMDRSPLTLIQAAIETTERQRAGELATSVDIELQTICIGAWAMATAPGEFFTSLGLAIKKDSRIPHTMLATYANGNIGYIPAREDYPAGGYEIEHAYRYYG
jgi:hypothetical protein